MSYAMVVIKGIAGDDAHDRGAFATVGVATHRKSGGETVTDWHDVVAFGARSENDIDRKAQLLKAKNGDTVYVIGSLEYRKADDGKKYARVVANIRLEVEQRGGKDDVQRTDAPDELPF